MFCITIFVYFSVVAVNFISKNCFLSVAFSVSEGFFVFFKVAFKKHVEFYLFLGRGR